MRQTGKRPVQEDAIAATRALGTGAIGLVALYLRAGDLTAALGKVESTAARRVIEPELYRALSLASEKNDAASWRGLMTELARGTRGQVGGELGIEEGLAEAGFFGALLETYRRDTTSVELAIQLAHNLIENGMSEAVPAVLAGAVTSPGGPEGEAAIALLGRAIEADARSGDFAGAEPHDRRRRDAPRADGGGARWRGQARRRGHPVSRRPRGASQRLPSARRDGAIGRARRGTYLARIRDDGRGAAPAPQAGQGARACHQGCGERNLPRSTRSRPS